MLKSLNAIFLKKIVCISFSFSPISHFTGLKAEMLVCRTTLISATWGKRIDGDVCVYFGITKYLDHASTQPHSQHSFSLKNSANLSPHSNSQKEVRFLTQTRPPFTLRNISRDTAISLDLAFVTNANNTASTTSVAFGKHMQIGVEQAIRN